MKKTIIEIAAGAAVACVMFSFCSLIIGQVCVLCIVKKFAYATLIGMPVGALLGINLVDRYLYDSWEFTFVGTLTGLAFTMILLLVGVYIVAIVPASFFTFPVLISLLCLLGHRIGLNIQPRKQVTAQRGNS